MKYSKKSLEKLESCHKDLQKLFKYALKFEILDITIVEGHRGKIKQNSYFNNGKSKVKYPDSKHNKIPSMAVDAVPYINNEPSWNKLHCCVLAGMVLLLARILNIKIRWGGSWSTSPDNVDKVSFSDMAHYELVDEEK